MATTAAPSPPVAKPARATLRWSALLVPLRLWHLLSLDAPTLAAVWMLTFVAGQTGRERWLQAASLAVAVWLLYVADRVLDAGSRTGPLEARHLFHGAHRARFAFAAAFMLPALLAMVAELPAPVRHAWLWLAVPMLVYAAAIHLFTLPRLPKEFIVAAIFATAASLPALVDGHGRMGAKLLAGALFAAVCWLNCMAISRWERAGLANQQVYSRSTAWGMRQFSWLAAAVAVVSALLLFVRGMALPAGACALSSLLLCLLDRTRRRMDAVTLRALADTALLTPLLLFPVFR